jgi:hypothetical protein
VEVEIGFHKSRDALPGEYSLTAFSRTSVGTRCRCAACPHWRGSRASHSYLSARAHCCRCCCVAV